MNKYHVARRRAVLLGMARTAFGLVALAAATTNSVAQRVSRPIHRPSTGLPNIPLRPGRLRPYTTGDPAGGALPGVFKVQAVKGRDNIVQLRDEDGRTADVYVDSHVYDLSTLSEGDEVAVDFFVPNDSNDRLEAASFFKLDPVRP
jgi:hypothetical protein